MGPAPSTNELETLKKKGGGYLIHFIWGFLGGAPANEGDMGRSPGGGNGDPLHYSCLKNHMDRGPWWATDDGVAKCQTKLSTHDIPQLLFSLPGI